MKQGGGKAKSMAAYPYADQLYNLRLHIGVVKSKIAQVGKEPGEVTT